MFKPYNRAELSFQLRQEIGEEGRNSKVYIAHDAQLDAELVIKKITKTSFADTEEYFQEASILHLSGHPNVVPIHYACEDSDFIYLAMPYYSNGSLNQLMNQRFLTVREIIKYAAQFLSGVHNIHSKKLIHFDIKPDNILISDQGEALVSDFGLSRPLAPNGLAGQDRNYLKMVPPEAFSTEEHSMYFDVYQAGLTIYRMCVGNDEFYKQFNSYGDDPDSFDRDSFRFDVRNGKFPNRDKFPEHIPQALINLIKKALDPNPTNRFPAVLHMVNAMANIDDESLDWQYSEPTDGGRVWVKSVNDRKVRLEIDGNGNSTATKTIARTQNIRDYSIESISRAKIKKFLRKF